MSQANGNGNGKPSPGPEIGRDSQIVRAKTGSDLATSEDIPATPILYDRPFDQAVVLRPSPLWPRLVVLTILGVVTFGVAWAYFAKLEQAVGAIGQLKPVGKVKEVQPPVGGLIQEVFVEDGEEIEPGAKILRFDQTAVEAQIKSLQEVQKSLRDEAAFYRNLRTDSSTSVRQIEVQGARLEVPTEVLSLARNRTLLLEQNRLFRALGNKGRLDPNLDSDALLFYGSALRAAQAQIEAARLEKSQLETQLTQVRLQLSDSQANLEIELEILEKLEPLEQEGAFATLQLTRQQQTVMQAEAAVNQAREEVARLELDIQQSDREVANIQAGLRRDIFDRIAQNKLQIAQIDSQLNKEIVENEKEISNIASQISQAQLQLQYQDLEAPIGGTVFDIQVGPGSVANASEVLLKIVPDSDLVAEIFVSNRDIGFVLDYFEAARAEGKPLNADIRIDS
ncbi:MAG: HlyD family efflux transporter periplasmic adaptor subunit, partial [Cyanobacteria bacterium J06641_5]